MHRLKIWLNGRLLQLKERSHYPEIFSVKTIMENEYEVTVEFDWKGITKDQKHLKDRTKHVWYVVDNPNERFARILKADIFQLQPLKIINQS